VSEPLVERFVERATLSGAHVHRGAAPEELGDDVGSSRALYGLADTGSVVLAAGPDEPRSRSLLPWVHVTELRETDILPGLPELFEALGGDLPSALAIVTGPSRSADIEQTLTIGVHGPGDVHIVLVD
jgi:L-lactate dehydrogenase complex protein LldG